MSATLPPNGSRGFSLPKFLSPLEKVGKAVSHVMLRILGDRMKVQGQNLLALKTFGLGPAKKEK